MRLSEHYHGPLGCTMRAVCRCGNAIHRVSRLVHANRRERENGVGTYVTGAWTHTDASLNGHVAVVTT